MRPAKERRPEGHRVCGRIVSLAVSVLARWPVAVVGAHVLPFPEAVPPVFPHIYENAIGVLTVGVHLDLPSSSWRLGAAPLGTPLASRARETRRAGGSETEGSHGTRIVDADGRAPYQRRQGDADKPVILNAFEESRPILRSESPLLRFDRFAIKSSLRLMRKEVSYEAPLQAPHKPRPVRPRRRVS